MSSISFNTGVLNAEVINTSKLNANNFIVNELEVINDALIAGDVDVGNDVRIGRNLAVTENFDVVNITTLNNLLVPRTGDVTINSDITHDDLATVTPSYFRAYGRTITRQLLNISGLNVIPLTNPNTNVTAEDLIGPDLDSEGSTFQWNGSPAANQTLSLPNGVDVTNYILTTFTLTGIPLNTTFDFRCIFSQSAATNGFTYLVNPGADMFTQGYAIGNKASYFRLVKVGTQTNGAWNLQVS
jgi:hypothetical protein